MIGRMKCIEISYQYLRRIVVGLHVAIKLKERMLPFTVSLRKVRVKLKGLIFPPIIIFFRQWEK